MIERNSYKLGDQISKDLKLQDQVCKAASTANRVLGMLKNTFVSRNPELWKRLYTTYVRPHLEYAVQVWNPYAKKDVAAFEKVQRRDTKISHILKNLIYEEILRNINLTSLEVRRKSDDLNPTPQNRKWHKQSQLGRRLLEKCIKKRYERPHTERDSRKLPAKE